MTHSYETAGAIFELVQTFTAQHGTGPTPDQIAEHFETAHGIERNETNILLLAMLEGDTGLQFDGEIRIAPSAPATPATT